MQHLGNVSFAVMSSVTLISNVFNHIVQFDHYLVLSPRLRLGAASTSTTTSTQSAAVNIYQYREVKYS